MIHRIAAAAFLALSLVACKQDNGGGNGQSTPVGAQRFTGLGDVRVVDAKLVPTSDSAAGISSGVITYVVAQVELTNDFGMDATPEISHFYFIDRAGNRFQAKDSGSSVFIGVSNSQQLLKQNEKRTYTIGFRTNDPNVAGTILYER
ncbi:hypothetical protein WPS_32770 [Vulcanimicrobium alpinum]|uniref:DUF4352 domain-containing protein n=1 Tax=Vulcanimicrobium alpinum TaxID=3016050 RepID=A0AAN1XZZ3_UNVUL|nr:hypothetical protein [Vulcanimicrobium alpinum]BDE08001.1 hypothetical protein WPS_32770 [Vulcanimicrobium alpinum]